MLTPGDYKLDWKEITNSTGGDYKLDWKITNSTFNTLYGGVKYCTLDVLFQY